MMALGFGQFANLVRESQSLAEVLEFVLLFQVVAIDNFPAAA
jgi:hypothetical protein